METSSLKEVFGSSLSLSELSGDTENATPPPPGYSRFGLNEHPPAHQMHTRVRRYSESPKSSSGSAFTNTDSAASSVPTPHHHISHKPRPLVVRLLLLGVLAVFHSVLMHAHIPPTGHVAVTFKHILLSTLICVVSAFVLNAVDAHAKSPISTILRLYGILLGFVYFANKLPREAGKAWLLIAPSMWYISNTSIGGLLAALSLSVLGGFISLAFGCDWLVAAGSAAAYFGSVLVFAEFYNI